MKRVVVGENELFYAKLDDLISRADSGTVAASVFLTPKEQHVAREYIRHIGRAECLFEFGGYSDAERRKFFFLPEYLSSLFEADGSLAPREVMSEELDAEIAAIAICGSGFKKLSHRDFLGSLMGLGIERHTLGDIVLNDENRAVIFCEPLIARYIKSELKKIGADSVRVSDFEVPCGFSADRKFKSISDTVASERLDCVVAALTGKSRADAQSIVLSGLVELDYEQCERNDRKVGEGSILSIRGHGKFVIRSISTETKKGRIRLLADKYV